MAVMLFPTAVQMRQTPWTPLCLHSWSTVHPPGEQSCGGYQPSPKELLGQPRPSPVEPFARSMSCSRASSETRGAEHGPTSGQAVPMFLCALEITGQRPKGMQITKIQPGGHNVNYRPLAVVFPDLSFYSPLFCCVKTDLFIGFQR